MHGSLEPEENVMTDTNEEHNYFAWRDGGIMDQVQQMIQELEWDYGDDIAVEVGGTSTYGIDGAGTKWAPKLGTVKYNKDAFIVIKNKSRDPIVPSHPNPELKQHHA
tara:strand:- start:486 stop:806 length:321 start_codon:yes stop_codon:yes gene_type:complete